MVYVRAFLVISNLRSEITRVPSQLSDSSYSTSNTLSTIPSSLPKSLSAESLELQRTDGPWRPDFAKRMHRDRVNETSDLTVFREVCVAESYRQRLGPRSLHRAQPQAR